ncbi:TPA: hypothetical protein ACOWSH_004820, partial [Enterobacter kobei]
NNQLSNWKVRTGIRNEFCFTSPVEEGKRVMPDAEQKIIFPCDQTYEISLRPGISYEKTKIYVQKCGW